MASTSERATRAAPFALRVVSRSQGLAAIVYRRRVNEHMQGRFRPRGSALAVGADGRVRASPVGRKGVRRSGALAAGPVSAA